MPPPTWGRSLECLVGAELFPIVDGIAVFLSAQQLSGQEEKERNFRGEESAWYDDMHAGYTDVGRGADGRPPPGPAPSSTPGAVPGASPRRSSRSASP